jgi:hypothetical protein
MTIRPIPRQGSFAFFDPDALSSKKPSGREKGAATYSLVEHVALLSIMSQVPDSFNCSESSPQWEEVYKRMIAKFYQSGPTRLSSALHGHFVDLYSAFKLGIRNLSLVDKEKKCPLEYKAGDDDLVEYVDAKKYQSKKWWSCSCQCILAIPLSLVVVPKLLAGCHIKRQCTRQSLRPIRRIGSMSWPKKGRLRKRSDLMWRKIVKLLQKHLHSLCRPFSSFPPHLLRLRMWEQWWNKRWLP